MDGRRPVIIGGHDSRRLNSIEDLKLLVRYPSREDKSVQKLDWIPEVEEMVRDSYSVEKVVVQVSYLVLT